MKHNRKRRFSALCFLMAAVFLTGLFLPQVDATAADDQEFELLGELASRYEGGDAGAIAQKLAQDGIRPNVICVDPPRKEVELFTGATVKSPRLPFTLSCTISILEQNATVTQETERSEEISIPPTQPSRIDSGTITPSGIPEAKLSR